MEEIIRWWPLYLDDQECVGKIQLCINLSMTSDNYGSAKVGYFLFLLRQLWIFKNSAFVLTLRGIVKIDAARWSSCGYNCV